MRYLLEFDYQYFVDRAKTQSQTTANTEPQVLKVQVYTKYSSNEQPVAVASPVATPIQHSKTKKDKKDHKRKREQSVDSSMDSPSPASASAPATITLLSNDSGEKKSKRRMKKRKSGGTSPAPATSNPTPPGGAAVPPSTPTFTKLVLKGNQFKPARPSPLGTVSPLAFAHSDDANETIDQGPSTVPVSPSPVSGQSGKKSRRRASKRSLTPQVVSKPDNVAQVAPPAPTPISQTIVTDTSRPSESPSMVATPQSQPPKKKRRPNRKTSNPSTPTSSTAVAQNDSQASNKSDLPSAFRNIAMGISKVFGILSPGSASTSDLTLQTGASSAMEVDTPLTTSDSSTDVVGQEIGQDTVLDEDGLTGAEAEQAYAEWVRKEEETKRQEAEEQKKKGDIAKRKKEAAAQKKKEKQAKAKLKAQETQSQPDQADQVEKTKTAEEAARVEQAALEEQEKARGAAESQISAKQAPTPSVEEIQQNKEKAEAERKSRRAEAARKAREKRAEAKRVEEEAKAKKQEELAQATKQAEESQAKKQQEEIRAKAATTSETALKQQDALTAAASVEQIEQITQPVADDTSSSSSESTSSDSDSEDQEHPVSSGPFTQLSPSQRPARMPSSSPEPYSDDEDDEQDNEKTVKSKRMSAARRRSVSSDEAVGVEGEDDSDAEEQEVLGDERLPRDAPPPIVSPPPTAIQQAPPIATQDSVESVGSVHEETEQDPVREFSQPGQPASDEVEDSATEGDVDMDATPAPATATTTGPATHDATTDPVLDADTTTTEWASARSHSRRSFADVTTDADMAASQPPSTAGNHAYFDAMREEAERDQRAIDQVVAERQQPRHVYPDTADVGETVNEMDVDEHITEPEYESTMTVGGVPQQLVPDDRAFPDSQATEMPDSTPTPLAGAGRRKQLTAKTAAMNGEVAHEVSRSIQAIPKKTPLLTEIPATTQAENILAPASSAPDNAVSSQAAPSTPVAPTVKPTPRKSGRPPTKPCILCDAIPAHLQRDCPIVTSGLTSVENRLKELEGKEQGVVASQALKRWQTRLVNAAKSASGRSSSGSQAPSQAVQQPQSQSEPEMAQPEASQSQSNAVESQHPQNASEELVIDPSLLAVDVETPEFVEEPPTEQLPVVDATPEPLAVEPTPIVATPSQSLPIAQRGPVTYTPSVPSPLPRKRPTVATRNNIPTLSSLRADALRKPRLSTAISSERVNGSTSDSTATATSRKRAQDSDDESSSGTDSDSDEGGNDPALPGNLAGRMANGIKSVRQATQSAIGW